jgi:hypothetical protein
LEFLLHLLWYPSNVAAMLTQAWMQVSLLTKSFLTFFMETQPTVIVSFLRRRRLSGLQKYR